ncbi:MAG TPA: hypothetical protein PLU91_14440 [Verrucomicrobiota bacterium]|nr:hypothetical protein [Verrucomicrobiota bacterium]
MSVVIFGLVSAVIGAGILTAIPVLICRAAGKPMGKSGRRMIFTAMLIILLVAVMLPLL